MITRPKNFAFRLFRYLLLNSAFAACLWFGLVEQVQGAANIAFFCAWLVSISSLFLLHKDSVQMLKDNGVVIPLFADQLFDYCVVVFLVWHSCFVTAAAYTVHALMVAAWHRKAFNEEKVTP